MFWVPIYNPVRTRLVGFEVINTQPTQRFPHQRNRIFREVAQLR